MTRGIVYVAFGDKARDEARMSIHTLRQHYDGPITVISSAPLSGAHFVGFDTPGFGARWAKLNLDLLTPYDDTLYLDADTRPRATLSVWFDLLDDGFDLVIAESTMQGQKALWHVDVSERDETLDGFGFTPLQLQAGVFAFRRSDAATALFAAWREEWRGGQDQAALLRALARVPVKLWVVSHHLSEMCVAHVWGKTPLKIHIVCKEPNPERILPRLAYTLAEQTGWSLGRTPRGDVDLNYFLPYLDFEPINTPTAAWFTHRDETHDNKVELWERVRAAVTLRTTSTTPYLNALRPYGPTVKVPVPLDRRQFVIAPSPSDFTVGVSGFVYEDGRKGEDLIRRLAADHPALRWQAIGRGWPVPTRQIETEALPGFYQALRLFICASRIEGVPYPPLEALACGIPVVIPRGVGLLDDLPDLTGIYRFDGGSYDSLKAALHRALDELQGGYGLDREALRAVTAGYTARAWALAHEQAFETLLNPPLIETLDDWHGRAGMYCVAFGDPARTCAERLLRTWQQFMPEVPSALVSDRPLGIESVFIQKADYDIGGRHAKLSIDELAPPEWQYALYLDADTELVAPVPFLFDLLADGWEFVICTNPAKYHTTRMMVRPDNKAEVERTYAIMGHDDMLQLNGGVFGYRRNARTAAFFERWITEWKQEAKRDQAALLRALWAEPLHLCVLTNVWNTMDAYNDPTMTAGILHHQKEARRVDGIVWERGDSEAAFKRVNR